MSRILVTGASGFVGRHLLPRLRDAGHDVGTAGRRPVDGQTVTGSSHTTIAELGPDTEWAGALDGRDVVLHLAAQLPQLGVAPLRYAIANDAGTRRLVDQAQAAGVSRLVFLSSIFAATDDQIVGHVPNTSYGRSKRAAETHVAHFAASAGRTGISLRPPLVYGPGATGNWSMLQRLAALPVPLPFRSVRNRRSVIAVENLVGAIQKAIDVPDAGGLSGTYAVADSGIVSLAEMLTWLRAGMDRTPWLLPAPAGFMRAAMRSIGLGQAAQSLLGDLVADTSVYQARFGWTPDISSRDGMIAAGRRLKGT